MQSSNLKEIINKFPSILNRFKGVYSIDTVPKYLAKNSFVILNTEEYSQPGQHWFCFIKKGPKNYELFDSLGIDENRLDHLKKYKIFPLKSKIKFNKTQVQNVSTETCGLFVLYFLIQRMHNLDLSFDTLLNEIFDDDVNLNENKVKNFAREHF